MLLQYSFSIIKVYTLLYKIDFEYKFYLWTSPNSSLFDQTHGKI